MDGDRSESHLADLVFIQQVLADDDRGKGKDMRAGVPDPSVPVFVRKFQIPHRGVVRSLDARPGDAPRMTAAGIIAFGECVAPAAAVRPDVDFRSGDRQRAVYERDAAEVLRHVLPVPVSDDEGGNNVFARSGRILRSFDRYLGGESFGQARDLVFVARRSVEGAVFLVERPGRDDDFRVVLRDGQRAFLHGNVCENFGHVVPVHVKDREGVEGVRAAARDGPAAAGGSGPGEARGQSFDRRLPAGQRGSVVGFPGGSGGDGDRDVRTDDLQNAQLVLQPVAAAVRVAPVDLVGVVAPADFGLGAGGRDRDAVPVAQPLDIHLRIGQRRAVEKLAGGSGDDGQRPGARARVEGYDQFVERAVDIEVVLASGGKLIRAGQGVTVGIDSAAGDRHGRGVARIERDGPDGIALLCHGEAEPFAVNEQVPAVEPPVPGHDPAAEVEFDVPRRNLQRAGFLRERIVVLIGFAPFDREGVFGPARAGDGSRGHGDRIAALQSFHHSLAAQRLAVVDLFGRDRGNLQGRRFDMQGIVIDVEDKVFLSRVGEGEFAGERVIARVRSSARNRGPEQRLVFDVSGDVPDGGAVFGFRRRHPVVAADRRIRAVELSVVNRFRFRFVRQIQVDVQGIDGHVAVRVPDIVVGRVPAGKADILDKILKVPVPHRDGAPAGQLHRIRSDQLELGEVAERDPGPLLIDPPADGAVAELPSLPVIVKGRVNPAGKMGQVREGGGVAAAVHV